MAKKQPMREHEDIVVFYNKQPTYNPQGLKDCRIKNSKVGLKSVNYGFVQKKAYIQTKTGYPASVLKIANSHNGIFHPTQKPLELGRYLVRTYSNKGDLVLDNACGSGTFLVAAKLEGRDFIGFETNKDYFQKMQQRLREVV
ncbi:MAG: site-specific DNA-methyltransferase [Legionellales bacterium]|nr:site-specific DNA-methyltransferase [Legionellales bacterium]